MLLDLTGLGFYSIPVMFITRIVKVLNKHFLHTTDNVILFNAPGFVTYGWTLIKQCFSAETNNRIKFASHNNNCLFDIIDAS